MHLVEAVLALITACIGFALVARRLNLPYAVILVLGGMALAFLPGLPSITLDPEVALAFFLPPLLQASAWRTDWRAFRANLRPILLLAVGAVLFTAAAVAVTAKWLIPDLPWPAAVALGAIVAPPDAVAASAVLARLNLPRRIVTVLEGESLMNDATALVTFRIAVATMGVGSVALGEAVVTFVLVAAGGIAVGWAVARAVLWAFDRLRDPLLEIATSFLAAFGSFLLAEQLHASGVMAVVTTGLLLGQMQHRILSARSRQSALAVWSFTEFVLTSLVFILTGLQLRGILERIDGHGSLGLLALALALSATLIVSRFVWVVPAVYLPRLLSPGLRRRDPTPPFSHSVVLSWAGMRGVVSLAAALALPLDFPHRDLLVFLSFCAILATLVVQGTTLEWVICRLGIEEPRKPGMPKAEAAVRRHVARASLAEIERRAGDVLEGAVARDLLDEFRDKTRLFHGIADGGGNSELEARLRIRLAALREGRAALLAHHRDGALDDELLAVLEQEHDLEEIRILQLLGIGTGHAG